MTTPRDKNGHEYRVGDEVRAYDQELVVAKVVGMRGQPGITYQRPSEDGCTWSSGPENHTILRRANGSPPGDDLRAYYADGTEIGLNDRLILMGKVYQPLGARFRDADGNLKQGAIHGGEEPVVIGFGKNGRCHAWTRADADASVAEPERRCIVSTCGAPCDVGETRCARCRANEGRCARCNVKPAPFDSLTVGAVCWPCAAKEGRAKRQSAAEADLATRYAAFRAAVEAAVPKGVTAVTDLVYGTEGSVPGALVELRRLKLRTDSVFPWTMQDQVAAAVRFIAATVADWDQVHGKSDREAGR